MNIPLIAKTVIDRYSNQQKIEIWCNNHSILVDAPFKPYFYSSYELRNLKPKHDIEIVKKKLFSTMQEEDIYKYSFDNTKYVQQYRELDSIESDIVFTDRILINQPDFFTQYPNTDKLKVLFFDIECDTTGVFPIPSRNAIIAIAAKCEDRKARYVAPAYDNDKEILQKFFKFIDETNPDILAHYYGNRFDIPYIMERAKINNIRQTWSRNNKEPYFFKETMHLGGRVSFDICNEVERDQTIYGIKNHKMKTLAKWLHLENIKEVPYSEMRNLVGTEELKEYIWSDIKITEFLFNIYFKNVLMLAQMNKVPLNLMVDASPSFLANLVHGRAFQKLGIVSDKTNGERYPKYIKNKKGALCDTFAPGLYNHKIYKVDYSSQYPRVVQTFNISPDTCKIIRYDNYTGEYKFDVSNPDKYIYSIPDDKANKNFIIEVDMSNRGFLAQFMDDVLTERFAIKKKMKELKKGSTEYEALHVRQNALKVIANVQTGYEGQEHARFGSLACYIMITGMARYYVNLAMEGIKCQQEFIKE